MRRVRKHFMLGSLPVSIDIIKPLQEQVLKHNICPVCHTKTLSEPNKTIGIGRVWRQCLSCNHVWIES